MKTGLSSNIGNSPVKWLLELQKTLGKSYDEMLELVKQHLKPSGYTHQELQDEGKAADPFVSLADIGHLSEVKSQNTHFYLYERATFVYIQAKRTDEFIATCEIEQMEWESRVTKLGDLMNVSQEAYDTLYDCSSENLNNLTQMARESGALGAHLVGAGWGGHYICLVKTDQVNDFLEKMMVLYKKERPEKTDRFIFKTEIGSGACIIDPQTWNIN